MKRTPEKIVAAIVAVALVGLISVQVYWAKRTYKEAEAVFNDKIIRMLNVVCNAANEEVTCFTLYSKTYIDTGEGIFMMKSLINKDETWDKTKNPDSIPMFFNIPDEYKNSPLNRVYKDLKFTSAPVTAEILLKFRFDMNHSSPEKKILGQGLSTDNFKDKIKNHEPLLSIYDTLMIDTLIRNQLKSNNMQLSYSYAFVKTNNDSIEYVSNKNIPQKVIRTGVRTRLSPEDMFSYPYDIIFYTNDKPQTILKNIIWILTLSVGIILLLLVSYIYFIRTILNQKKLSEMKNDFINNMTHEFNTPLANISLAYETLREKEKIIDDSYSNRITGIIHGETERLKENVTRILRLSSFEKNGLDLIYELADLKELVTVALSRLELKIKQKEAEISLRLPDTPVIYRCDKLHLSNAIENLIDNALKYSNDKCKIEIELFKSQNEIIFSVRDNGIGINKKEQERIFDKFYRVQHGNIQNDRGFGLGLNYVKFVVEAHGGKINVDSCNGTGSCFNIILNKDER